MSNELASLKDTVPVRKGEELNLANLEDFIKAELGNFADEKLAIEQFSAGHSNLTYQLRMGDWEAVLRRPPLGPVAPKAHDMHREYQILQAIHPLFPAAPKPLLYSGDEAIIGSPFFLMERKRGYVLDTEFPDGIHVTESLCNHISHTMVDTLVRLHEIDYKKTKLAEMSKPDGFMERQVHGWLSRYERAKTEDIKEVEQLRAWLIAHIPQQAEATIIHYDYKLNNAMLSVDLSEVVGLFDWEMTTIGDPLADLGVAMSYWIQADDPDLIKKGLGKLPVTVTKGFMTREQFIQAYAKKSGRDVSNINFYLTFANFKLAVICQQIYYRYKQGTTNDKRFAHFNLLVQAFITQAIYCTRQRP